MLNTLGLQSIVFITTREKKMLTTQREHELPTFPFAAGPSVQTWRTVTLHVGVMYVFVSYSLKHGRGWLPQTTVFWRHEDVLKFCIAANKDKKRNLIEVFLLIPNLQESPHQWSFLPIQEILTKQEDQTEVAFPVYVTADGTLLGGAGFGQASEAAEIVDQEALEKVFQNSSVLKC